MIVCRGSFDFQDITCKYESPQGNQCTDSVFLLQLSPLPLQQMRFTKIRKVVDELSAQQQYNKSWSTSIMSHAMKLVGHWFKTGKTKYFFVDGSKLLEL